MSNSVLEFSKVGILWHVEADFGRPIKRTCTAAATKMALDLIMIFCDLAWKPNHEYVKWCMKYSLHSY